jgi:hypothetical protein
MPIATAQARAPSLADLSLGAATRRLYLRRRIFYVLDIPFVFE